MSGISGIVNSSINVNGMHLKANLRELKAGVGIDQAYRAGLKDGIDQVYLQAGDRKFVLQGDGLALSGFKQSILPKVQIAIDGRNQSADVMAIDNEKNTASEGWWNLGTKAGVAGIGLALLLGSGNKAGAAAVKATLVAVGAAVAVTGGAAAIGAYRSASNTVQSGRLDSLLKP